MKHTEEVFKRLSRGQFISSNSPDSHTRAVFMDITENFEDAGDLDLAGVRIFLTEYKPFLGERAEYFIPDDYEERIRNGTPERYDAQARMCRSLEMDDKALEELILCIRKHRKGYDQEGYCI